MKYHSFFVMALTAFILMLAFHSTHAQIFHRENKETAEQFARKNLHVKQWAHPVIETVAWGSKKTILAFIPFKKTLSAESSELENCIIGYLFSPIHAGNYHRAVIDTFHEEGAAPAIAGVFFVNADKDKEREMVIMVKWRQQHKGSNGYVYDSFIYDNPNLQSSENTFTSLKKFRGKFLDADGSFEGKERMAKYKTPQSVRAALKRMGY